MGHPLGSSTLGQHDICSCTARALPIVVVFSKVREHASELISSNPKATTTTIKHRSLLAFKFRALLRPAALFMAIDLHVYSNGPPGTHQEPPDEDNMSDSSSELVEIDNAEFPSFFEERGDRLFHSHGRSPYPLPIDADEQHRLNRQHALLRGFLDNHYVGPVTEVLRPGARRHVIDLCTGTGRWVMDMAAIFPHVHFDGCDIVPIQTRNPLDNVTFEMHDIADRFRHRNGTVDFVHARDISLCVRNYPALIREVARVLRPGGLFVSCEWDSYPCMIDGTGLGSRAPRTHHYFSLINSALHTLGVRSIAGNVPRFLEQSHVFTDIQCARFTVPVGPWQGGLERTGERLMTNVLVYAQSILPLLLEGEFVSRRDAVGLIEGIGDEIDNVPGIVLVYNTVHARRI